MLQIAPEHAVDPIKIVGAVIESARLRRFCIKLLDMNLLGGAGFAVLRYRKTLPFRPLFIIFTNVDLPWYRQTAIPLRASHYRDKGRDFRQLAEFLGQLAEAEASALS